MQIDRSLLKMKLNLTNEKLTRLLLSANPVLVNCKGSVKAVRLFMNMLGMKCIPIVNGLCATFTVTNLGADPSYNGICEAISNGADSSEYYSYMVTNHYGMLFAREENFGKYHNVFSMQISGPDSNNKSTITLVPWTDEEIIKWNNNHSEYPNMQIDLAGDFALRQKYTLFAYNDVIKNFKTYQNRTGSFEGATISENYTAKSAQSNPSNDVLLCVTNVTDKDLQPIKTVLTKQLQEILPINMIVTEDHIIGCANE